MIVWYFFGSRGAATSRARPPSGPTPAASHPGMVFYFTPRRAEEGYLLYMGRDKYENEDLIKYALPVDVWFHVDALSSAHVYLRTPEGVAPADIPPEPLEDAVQLVKANSIQGCKLNNLDVVHTPAANLRKTASMDVGQVGFFNDKEVRKVRVAKKDSDVVNRLNRSKVEAAPDLEAQRDAWDREQRGRARAAAMAQKAAEKAAKEDKKREIEARSYDRVMREEDMVTVAEMREKYATPEEYEDDFM